MATPLRDTTGFDIDAPIIAGQNDAFRSDPVSAGIPGTVLFAGALADAEQEMQTNVLSAVRTFDSFTDENDPHGEHDFGSFEIGDDLLMWKIDYYDNEKSAHSPNKAEKSVTHRVLTIFFASDY